MDLKSFLKIIGFLYTFFPLTVWPPCICKKLKARNSIYQANQINELNIFRLEKEHLTKEQTESIEKTKPSSTFPNAPEDVDFDPDMFHDDGGLVEAVLHDTR